jgi:hypothetical protein
MLSLNLLAKQEAKNQILDALRARKARQELQKLKMEKIQKIEDQKNKIKSIYANVIQDATNSALSRLVELDGKQFVAKYLATESSSIKLKPTLAQKLGLEERFREEEKNNITPIIDTVVKKMPRFAKGSQEAKDYMARIRAMRKGRSPKPVATYASVLSAPAPKKRGRPRKAPAVVVSAPTVPAKRRGRPPKIVASAPTPTYIPFAPIYNAKAKRRVGRPRKNKNAKSVAEIASLLTRARFGKARRYRGGKPSMAG